MNSWGQPKVAESQWGEAAKTACGQAGRRWSPPLRFEGRFRLRRSRLNRPQDCNSQPRQEDDRIGYGPDTCIWRYPQLTSEDRHRTCRRLCDGKRQARERERLRHRLLSRRTTSPLSLWSSPSSWRLSASGPRRRSRGRAGMTGCGITGRTA